MGMDILDSRGQINIGFVVAIILLSFILVSVTVHLLDMVPGFKEASERIDIEARAFDLNELLINDPGVPANWSTSPTRVGLAYYDKYYGNVVRGLLDATKISYVNSSMNYTSLKDNLGLDNDTDFRITIENGSTTLLDMYDSFPAQTRNVLVITRVIVIGTNDANVTLKVW